MYVDESKAGAFVLVAASLQSSRVVRSRAQITRLLVSGQQRLHMKSERESRRREILRVMVSIAPEITVVVAPKDGRSQVLRRRSCLAVLVGRCGPGTRLVIERDETLIRADRQTIIESIRGPGERIVYGHQSAREEPLLAIPDAVAWAWCRGGAWRSAVVRDFAPVIIDA